jgi:glycosyltransferase involved in cell wall biosynthesis
MHILVTTDTVGGVWTYTRELVTGLVTRGARVTLVSFGGVPGRAQRSWMNELPGVRYYPTSFRLEWMQDSEDDISESCAYLLRVIAECKPDLLHLNQYCFGSINTTLPKLIVAHSDMLSWFQEVRGEQPSDAWTEWYRGIVARGLAGASVVAAPSRWMLDCMELLYGSLQRSRVIYNGRTPLLFRSAAQKQSLAVSAGRLWDEGKQMGTILRLKSAPFPIHLAGAISMADESPDFSLVASNKPGHVHYLGELAEPEMLDLLGRAAVYIATSKYEPFGLSPLEAALSHCALVVNDIPSFREIWGDAALYFRRDDASSLGEVLKRLNKDAELCLEYADRAFLRAVERYSADRMVDEYLQLYSALLERRVSAA